MTIKKNSNPNEQTISFVEALKRRWMATVDAIVDPMMIVNRNYEITQANKALALHAHSDVKALLGKKCHKVFAGQDSPCKGCTLVDTWKSQKPHNFELEENTSQKFFEVTSQPIFDVNGKIEGSLQIYRDRTSARQMRKQLLQNEKLASIGLLAGGIAHEINNPLAGILIFSQMILREMDPKATHYQDVQEIETATQRCKAIVENLLDFARQKPETNAILENVDLNDAVRSALKFASVGSNTDHITVELDLSEGQANIMGDRNKSIQILLNLIQNALHAMPNKGVLFIRSMTKKIGDQEKVVIEIEDTGVGIAEQDINKIFDPFYTSKAESQGTGLGLSICYGLAEDMNGSIEVRSKLNQGSCFSFLAPAAKSINKSA